MREPLGWLGRFLAYLFYTALVLLVLLWLLLPKQSLLQWLTGMLNTNTAGLEWQVQALDIGPVKGLVLTNVQASVLADAARAVFVADRLTLQPQVGRILRSGQGAFSFQATLYGGTISGSIVCLAKNECTVEGQMEGVLLDGSGPLHMLFDRSVQGVAAGTFSVKGSPLPPMQLEGEVELVATQGHVALLHPVLGHEYIDFSKGTVSIQVQGDKVGLSKGMLDSDLFMAQFEGEVDLASPLAGSTLHIHGDLQPWTGMFAKIGSPQAIRMIREELQDGTLPFSITGTANAPAIDFAEYSLFFESLQQRLDK